MENPCHYDESIDRFLNIFERVHREHPIDGLRWFIDHAERCRIETLNAFRSSAEASLFNTVWHIKASNLFAAMEPSKSSDYRRFAKC